MHNEALRPAITRDCREKEFQRENQFRDALRSDPLEKFVLDLAILMGQHVSLVDHLAPGDLGVAGLESGGYPVRRFPDDFDVALEKLKACRCGE